MNWLMADKCPICYKESHGLVRDKINGESNLSQHMALQELWVWYFGNMECHLVLKIDLKLGEPVELVSQKLSELGVKEIVRMDHSHIIGVFN